MQTEDPQMDVGKKNLKEKIQRVTKNKNDCKNVVKEELDKRPSKESDLGDQGCLLPV